MTRDDRLREEIEFHIEQQIAKNRRAGMSDADARRDALVRFGGVERAREAAHDEVRGAAARDLLRDLRIAFRTLGRTPAFAVTAILTFGLGLGAATAMFTVVNGVLLTPLPYPQSDRIVRLYQLGEGGARNNVSHPNFEDWRTGTHSFQSMSEMQQWGRTPVAGALDPQMVTTTMVSSRFFDAMGVKPGRGRGFSPDEQKVGAPITAIVGAGLWSRMGNRAQPAGERLTIGPYTATVIGVMPEGFDYPGQTGIWLPLDVQPANQYRTGHNYQALARLADGVPLEAAQNDISALSRRLKIQYGDGTWMFDAAAVPVLEVMTGGVKPALRLLFLASILLLVVAATNLSNLLVAQCASRRREFAVQLAIGATPGRITRQLLAETLALSICGAALGLLIATFAVRLFAAIGPAGAPRLASVAVDITSFQFAAAAALVIALVLAAVTAWTGRIGGLAASLADQTRTGSSGRRQVRVREALIVTEVALTLVLVAGAGLLGRSFAAVLTIDPGYRTDDALIAELTMSDDGQAASVSRRVVRQQEILQRLSALPGVEAVGLINAFPMGRGNFNNGQFLEMTRVDEFSSYAQVQALGAAAKARAGQAAYRQVNAGYFKAMGIPLLKGRLIDDGDGPGAAQVAVISQSLADTKWPNQDPLGRYLQFGNMDGDMTGMRIVGVVGDVREVTPEAAPGPMLYASFSQRPRQVSTFSIVVRGPAPAQISDSVRRIVREIDPAVPVELRTISETLNQATGNRRFNFWLVGAFSVFALILATVGVYGLMAFTVAQRTREMGIRMALGAEPRALVARVVRRGVALAGLGVAVGLALALSLTGVIKSLLFGVATADPLVLGSGIVLLVSAATAASYLPARRILRQSPAVTLRGA